MGLDSKLCHNKKNVIVKSTMFPGNIHKYT
jgi:hypothetical protein